MTLGFYYVNKSQERGQYRINAGADQKYCRQCISDKLKMIRGLTFAEFYGNGVVD